MTAGLIVILAALIPFIIQVLSTKIAKDASPAQRLSDENEKIDKAIGSNDARAVTAMLNTDLQRLQDAADSHIK